MHRNKLILFLLMIFLGVSAGAQTSETTEVSASPAASATTPNTAAKQSKTKKKIKINFEDENVTGNFDVPDTMFMSSRRLIKYKELFNKRTNFIDEIESNKGLFNEH